MDYIEKFKDPRWQKKRLEILERDDWKCQDCGDKDETLHIHHRIYKNGIEPWEYDNRLLITLCESCHKSERKHRLEEENILIQLLKVELLYGELNLLVCNLSVIEKRDYALIGLLGYPKVAQLLRKISNIKPSKKSGFKEYNKKAQNIIRLMNKHKV